MRIWTYSRPFQFQGQNYEVKYFFSLSHYTSQLYRNGELIGQDSRSFEDGLEVLEHRYALPDIKTELVVQVGYFSWWNIGIEVSYGGEMVYASHPGKDLHFASKKVDKITPHFKKKLGAGAIGGGLAGGHLSKRQKNRKKKD